MTTWKDDRNPTEPKKRPIQQIPEGYYSGDKPNPHLREFVEKNMTAYDPEKDDYQVEPFNEAITTTKATAIYKMHTYWSKKPHDAIRQYIRHYTKPGDIVLDPFCGSGGTALAALMEGRKAIAIDRSPAATFITKNYCTPADVTELQEAFEELKQRVMPEIDWLYETKCDRCGGKATTAYTVYSQRFRCPRCLEIVALFDCQEIEGRTLSGKPKKIRVCPNCQKRGIHEPIKSTGEHYGAVPVLVSYICENGCKPARDERTHDDLDPRKREYFERYDLEKIKEIEKKFEEKEMRHWYPEADLAKAIPYRMLYKKDFRPVDASKLTDLFTTRNLWALATLFEAAASYDDLRLMINSSIIVSSRMAQHHEGGGGYISGTYYLPILSKERNVFTVLMAKRRETFASKNDINKSIPSLNIVISNQNAYNMSLIASDSIDYIFTDPPYSDTVQFGELNFLWEAWLNLDTHWLDDEIIVNEIRGKTVDEWADKIRQSMKECYRILKPNRWISLCYHDTSEYIWTIIQDTMAEIGFLADKNENAIFIDTGGRTYNQSIADKVTKRDLVINFRKPTTGEVGGPVITELDDFGSFQEKVVIIITDFLADHPGSTKDHVYDEVVSRMVRKGQMESHHFEELLTEVAEPVQFESERMARWYLKQQAEAQDEAETRKEDAAAATVSRRISELLAKNPEAEGVHYSDIFEHYIYAVQDKPRRSLAEWLADYYYKNADGTWRLPADEDEEHLKQEGRAAGLSRSIKRYLSYLEQNIPVPEKERPGDATLADWIRHAKRSGQYNEGKLLYEKGGLRLDRLSEEGQINVDEDYMVCARMLSRKVEGRGRR